MTFGRKPKILIDVESNADIKVLTNFKEYYEFLKDKNICRTSFSILNQGN